MLSKQEQDRVERLTNLKELEDLMRAQESFEVNLENSVKKKSLRKEIRKLIREYKNIKILKTKLTTAASKVYESPKRGKTNQA